MIFLTASLYGISSSPGSLGSVVRLSGHAVLHHHHEHCDGKEEGCHIYVSDVIKLLKLFLVMSELSEMFWGKMHRIWSLGGLNVAELQGQGNKEMCLVFVGRMIFAPHWRCQFVDLGSGWGDRKDLPIRSFQPRVIQWWSEELLCEHIFTVWFETLAFGEHTNDMLRNCH